MSEATLRVHLPRLPHPEIFDHAGFTIRSKDGKALLTYDPNTQSGFVYVIALQRWTILAPIGFDEFIGLVALSGVTMSEGPDLHRWIETCMASPAGNLH